MHHLSARAATEDPLLCPADQTVVPVLGMHRCGTSMVTRLLDLLGMELGWPLQPPDVDNPKGFWEHRLFQGVNIQLLEALGGHRDGYGTPDQLMSLAQQAASATLPDAVMQDLKTRLSQHFMHPQWGFKDPRTTVLWPLWQRLLPALGYTTIRPVIVVRDPIACVQSLTRRGDVSQVAAGSGVELEAYLEHMWGAYYHILLKSGVAELSPLVLCQEDLLDPHLAPIEVQRMAAHIGAERSRCDDALRWIDVGMDHRTADKRSADPRWQRVYSGLRELAMRQREGFIAQKSATHRPVAPMEVPAEDPRPTSHCIYVVSPLGYPGSQCFDELALSLHHGFEALGIQAPIVRDPSAIRGIPVVLGANQIGKFLDTSLAHLKLPDDAILYNLEQVDETSSWMDASYLALLKQFRVWDYSAANVGKLAAMGISVDGVCGIGHVPQLERIADDVTKDIDVLFYGSVNDRRLAVLQALEQRGLRVVVSTNLYGDARDSLVARSRVVLNIHFYPAKVLEMVRLSYLLANGCAVVSETGADPAEEAPFRDAIAFAAYDELVDRCVQLVDHPEEAACLGDRAREAMRARPQSSFLSELLQ
jgi:hypothetical protein